MKVKKLIVLLFYMCLVLNVFAQEDSTFVCYYSPTYETHPFWYFFPISGIDAANVFEKYDGSFGMQLLSTFHTPPPEMVFPQSPIVTYNRRGQYLNTTFGPFTDESLIPGYYSHIIKDGLGGYLALDMFEHRIHRLSNNLQFVEWVQLETDTGTLMSIMDLIIENNGFIVVSNHPGYIIAKFTSDLNCLWSTPLPAHQHKRLRKLSDGSYVNLWWYSPHFRVMKISTTGDTIWTKQLLCEYVDDFIEINNRFYGFAYWSININTVELRIYDFGIDFENEDPGDPILVIPTYPLLGNDIYGLGDPYSVIRTSDNCIIIAVSTPIGEIFKFDSNFNLIWSSNALQNEKIGIGFHPLIELGNGDFLYCALVEELPYRLALVRIDSNGNYVGIDDDTEQTPAKPAILVYPNPFRREIILEMKVADSSVNLLEVYNIKGQLVESKTIRGTKATWTPQNLPSGVYILKFMGNSKQIASKMITYIR
ncbi:MAG: T9SS type A sorting domain-containing protein [Candidatus Cloacimonetes bacterium]|nr:T9SS type A sorting domain-containing protein [Candidatus Cloacimonadota bacterium]